MTPVIVVPMEFTGYCLSEILVLLARGSTFPIGSTLPYAGLTGNTCGILRFVHPVPAAIGIIAPGEDGGPAPGPGIRRFNLGLFTGWDPGWEYALCFFVATSFRSSQPQSPAIRDRIILKKTRH